MPHGGRRYTGQKLYEKTFACATLKPYNKCTHNSRVSFAHTESSQEPQRLLIIAANRRIVRKQDLFINILVGLWKILEGPWPLLMNMRIDYDLALSTRGSVVGIDKESHNGELLEQSE